MIEIRFSNSEAEISGSAESLQQLSLSISDFLALEKSELFSQAFTEFDPSPYDQALTGLRLFKSSGLLMAAQSAGELHISSSPDGLLLLCQNIMAEASSEPYELSHIHFDFVGWPDVIDQSSAELIIRLQPNKSFQGRRP